MKKKALKITVTGTAELQRVCVQGAIDEFAEQALKDARKAIKAARVEVDLSGVTALNSRGISDWMDFTHELAPTVALTRCAGIMVDYANVLPDALGDATVDSVMTPYSCARCNTNQDVETDEATAARLLVSHPPCRACGTALKPDVELAHFFSVFAGNGKRRAG